MRQKSLIVGLGEVGDAISKILLDAYGPENVAGITRDASFGDIKQSFDIMHVCIGYSDQFIEQVDAYQKIYKPKYTVIHSTVPVGTTRKLNAIHSPIRGVHPNLEGGIRTFPKFLAGPNVDHIADYFRRAGLKVILFEDPEISEAGKLFDTEYYRACIEFSQRVKAYCSKYNLNFHEVYTIFNTTYNEGYVKLGYPEVVRPVLEPIMKPIGGHCVVPNSKLIKQGEMAE